MTVLDQLAHARGLSDESANVALAVDIAGRNDKAAIGELVEGLSHKVKGVRHDCIKVLYEVGALKPKLIASHAEKFLAQLTSPDNRMVWGAMMALATLTPERADWIVTHLDRIFKAAKAGSVITRDGAVKILAKLCSLPAHVAQAGPPLLDLVETAPLNQLPMYAELAAPAVPSNLMPQLVQILNRRCQAPMPDAKAKRLAKVIVKLKPA